MVGSILIGKIGVGNFGEFVFGGGGGGLVLAVVEVEQEIGEEILFPQQRWWGSEIKVAQNLWERQPMSWGRS
jgi:hypothetical protein